MFLKTMRGALFGMDARIALLIFAVLSTVSGFVLYQRAEEAQDIKLYAGIQEIEKGLLLMQRDLGVLPHFAVYDGDTSWDWQFYMLCDRNAIADGFKNRWKGPYINKSVCNNVGVYKTDSTEYFLGWGRATGVDSSNPPQNGANSCTATSDCYAWIGIGIATAELAAGAFSYINRIVDEPEGSIEINPEDTGRVTLYNTSLIWYRTEVGR